MRYSIAAILLSLLSACSGPTDGGAQEAGQAADKGANDVASLRPGETARFVDGQAAWLQPGRWETVMTVAADHRPNTSSDNSPQTTSQCLAGAQSQRPPANFLLARGEQEACDYQHFSMESGHLYVAGQCEPEGSRLFFIASGPFTPTSYELIVRAQGRSGEYTFDNDLRLTSRRAGEC